MATFKQLGKYHNSSLSSESAHRGTLDQVIVVVASCWLDTAGQSTFLRVVGCSCRLLTYIKPRGKSNYGSTKLQGVQLLSRAKHTL